MTICDSSRTLSGESSGASSSPAKAWLSALELTAPIAQNPERIFHSVIEELAQSGGEAPALLSDEGCLTYRALVDRSNQYTRWALDQGLAKGDAVCLLMPNRPEYMAIWLGITRIGCTVALLNTNLMGPSLAHSVNIIGPEHVIVAAELMDRWTSALPDIHGAASVWVYGEFPCAEFRRLDLEIEACSPEKLTLSPVTIDDPALWIYTSGTTGLPKAARVSHGRVMQWSHWFAGMLQTDATDRLYNCLPMYHSVGGVLATGAVLVAGGSVVIRKNFSAGQFWSDIVRWDCTLFQYVGELCRYLMRSEISPREAQHHIRMCCGNGLRSDMWEAFRSRFRIPRILEFYAATESNVSLFNVEGKPGAIGRIPSYLAHRFPARLVRFDTGTSEPMRDREGFCIRCLPNETGEAIGKIFEDKSNVAGRFEGYASEQATEQKILRDVFESGDAWFRTGDLMRRDEQGYFYFVDRIGDTFRWKGENVATSEVEDAICAFPGIEQANVYGVSIPDTDGRAGMAELVAGEDLNVAAFRSHLLQRLPGYAQPLFLRIREELELTATLKYRKTCLPGGGYDPSATPDPIYFNHPELGAFVRLDTELYERIQTGQVRL